MAKKKKTKKKADEPEASAPEASVPEDAPEDAPEAEAPPTAGDTLRAPSSHSLPPTKKSNLPPELAHDDREIDAAAIVKIGAVVLLLTGASLIGAYFILSSLVSGETQTFLAPPPMATGLPSAPPDPRLQREPEEGLVALRADEARDLEGYGWVDKKEGIVRIPIERAIELTAERGLPSRADIPPQRRVSHPTDSGLGEIKGKGGTP